MTAEFTDFGQGFATVAYRLDGDMVMLRGLAMPTGAAPPATSVTTFIDALPVGYRPAATVINACIFAGGDGYGTPGRCDVTPDGIVQLVVNGATTFGAYVDVSNVRYSITP